MRLRRWRVVASVRVFPSSGRCRSLPAAAVFLFVSVAPAVHACVLVRLGVLSFLAPAVLRCRFGFFSVSFRLRGAVVAPSVWRGAFRFLCAERVVAAAPRAGVVCRGSSAEHQRCGVVLLRTLGDLAAISAERCRRGAGSVFPFNAVIIRASIHQGLPSPGVALPGQRASSTGGRLPPARPTAVTTTPWVFSSTQHGRPNHGPTLPGATGWSPSSGAGDSSPAAGSTPSRQGDCHRRSELHCCRRHITEGHFRGAAHIIAEREPAPTVHTPQEHNTAAAGTTRRTIRAPRTHQGCHRKHHHLFPTAVATANHHSGDVSTSTTPVPQRSGGFRRKWAVRERGPTG